MISVESYYELPLLLFRFNEAMHTRRRVLVGGGAGSCCGILEHMKVPGSLSSRFPINHEVENAFRSCRSPHEVFSEISQ